MARVSPIEVSPVFVREEDRILWTTTTLPRIVTETDGGQRSEFVRGSESVLIFDWEGGGRRKGEPGVAECELDKGVVAERTWRLRGTGGWLDVYRYDLEVRDDNSSAWGTDRNSWT